MQSKSKHGEKTLNTYKSHFLHIGKRSQRLAVIPMLAAINSKARNSNNGTRLKAFGAHTNPCNTLQQQEQTA